MRRVHRKAAQGIPPRARSVHSPAPLVSSAVDQVQHSLRTIVSKALASSDSHPALADLLESCARLQQDLRNATFTPQNDQEEGEKGSYQQLSRILAEAQASLFEHITANPALDPLKLKAGIWEAFSDLSNRLFREFVTNRRQAQPSEWAEMKQENAEVKKINEELLKELSDAQTESRKLMDFVSKLHEEKVTLSKRVAEGHTQAEFYKSKAKKAAETQLELSKRNEELRLLNETAVREMKAVEESCELLKEDLARLERDQEEAQLRNEVEGLRLKLETRERDLGQINALLQGERDALATKTTDLQMIQSQLQSTLHENQTLTALADTKQQALLAALQATESAQKEQEELRNSLKTALEQIEKGNQAAIVDSGKAVSQLKAEIQSVEARLKEAMHEKDQLQGQFAQIKGLNQTLTEELNAEKTKLQQEKEAVEQLHLEIDTFKRKFQETEVKTEHEKADLKRENADIKQNHAELLKTMNELKERHEAVASSLNAQVEAQRKAVDTLQAELSTAQLHLQTEQNSANSLRKQLSAFQTSEIAQRTEIETEAKIQVQTLEKALKAAEMEGNGAKSLLETVKSELVDAKETAVRKERELQGSVEAREREIAALREELARLKEEEMGVLREEKEHSESSREELQSQLVKQELQWKSALLAKDQEISTKQSLLDQAHDKITHFQQIVSENSQQQAGLREELETLHQSLLLQVQNSQSTEKSLQQALEIAQTQANKRESELIIQLQTLESELKETKDQMESAKTASAALRQQLDMQSQQSETAQTALKAQINGLERTASAASVQAQEAEAAKENLIDQLADEKSRYKKLLERSQKLESDLKKNFILITQLEEQCQALQRSEEQRDITSDLQTRLSAAEEATNESERKLKDALQLAEQLCKAVEEAERQKAEAKEHLEVATGELKLVHSRARELESELEVVRQSAEQAQLDVLQTLKDEEALQSAYSQLQRDLNALQQAKATETAQRQASEQKYTELQSRVEEMEQELQFGRQSGNSDDQEARARLENERVGLMQKIEDLEMELESFKFERQGNTALSSPRISDVMDMGKRQVITTDLLDFEDESPLYSAEKTTPARMRVCKSVRHDLQIWCLLADQSDEPDYVWMKQEDIDPGLRRPPVLDDDLEDQRQEFEEKLGEMEDDLEAARRIKDRLLDILNCLLPCPADQDTDTYIETFLEAFKMQPFEAVMVGSSEDGSLAPEEAQSLMVTISRLKEENEQLEQTLQLQEQQLRLLHEEHRARAEGETGQTPERHFAEIFANFARTLPQL